MCEGNQAFMHAPLLFCTEVNTMGIEIPGVAWVTLALLLAQWGRKWIRGSWAPILIIFLDAVAKALELWWGPPVVAYGSGEKLVGLLIKFFFGG